MKTYGGYNETVLVLPPTVYAFYSTTIRPVFPISGVYLHAKGRRAVNTCNFKGR